MKTTASLEPRNTVSDLRLCQHARSTFVLAALCFLGFARVGSSQDLVTNGGFAGAGLTGWIAPAPSYIGYVGEPGSAGGGRGDWIGLNSIIYQDLPTVPGESYLLTFSVQGDNPQQSFRIAYLRVSWGDEQVAWYVLPNYPPWYFPKYVLRATNNVTRLQFQGFGYAGLDNVSLTPAPTTQPRVEITSPVSGARFVVNENITFSAAAFATNGAIARVEYYYSGINLIGVSMNPPFSVMWSNVPAGNFVISAKATSTAGQTTTSVGLPIVVETRPLVRIDSPPSDAVFTNGQNITIRTTVLNNDGRLTQVEFFRDTNLLRTITGVTGNPALNVTWSNAPIGNYTLFVIGKNSSGNVLSASNVVVHVMPPAIQDQFQSAFGARIAVNRSLSVAQTFTPAINGRLHDISFVADEDATWDGAPVTAVLVDATNGVPGTNVLGTGIVNLYYSLAAYFPSNEIYLKATRQYAVVFSSATAPGVNISFYTSFPADLYRGGMLWQRAPGGAWQPATYFGTLSTTNSDLVFVTYMTPDRLPDVRLRSPTNLATSSFPANIALSAEASDADGSVALVEFFDGTNALGAVTSPPYDLLWTNASLGNHSLTARATDNHGFQSTSPPVQVSVHFVNIAPSFNAGADQVILEDAGLQSVPGWATGITAGPVYEAGQTLTFVTTNDNLALFSLPPSVDPAGTLTYVPATNANGVASVTVVLQDNGGTDNGGQDSSMPQTFHITVIPVNDPPVAQSQSVTLDEDTTVAIMLGAFDVEGDPLTFTVGTPVHGALTGTAPNLVYQPATNYFGPDSFTFSVSDGQTNSELATVSITVRPVNDPPVAEIVLAPLNHLPGLTNLLVIAPVGTNATVILDGSRSTDVENDPLQYFWSEGTNTFATGMLATNQFAPGLHTITLIVSDGQATGTNSVGLEVLSPAQAVATLEELVENANLGRKHTRLLLASLRAAAASFDRGHVRAGIKQLRAFQKKVLAQIAPLDPALAATLIESAQEIIDVLSPPAAPGPVAIRNQQLEKMSGGKFQLRFQGPRGCIYFIEASTNLTTWQIIGVARDLGPDGFDFEDVHTARFSGRFYRIASP